MIQRSTTSDGNERPALLRVHPRDDVAVALRALRAGESLAVGEAVVAAAEAVPEGHKLALRAIERGAEVIKYGCSIGRASAEIPPGAWVHTHNLASALGGEREYEYRPAVTPLAPIDDGLTFEGYVRADGGVGIRNEVWIVPLVGCVNRVAEMLAREAAASLPDGVDGVHAFPHPHGCSQQGADLAVTQRTLAGLVRHPNAGGVLALGLGCENNEMQEFKAAAGDGDPRRVRFMLAQEVEDELEAGGQLLRELIEYAARFKRETVPAARLRVGLKCGGSDGYSGLTANPLVGAFSDRVVARGGATALTEAPEMFGAEQLLMNRAVDRDVFRKTVELINAFKRHYARWGETARENPSPGNKAGGLTTLEEKSLGCVQKGGAAPVTDVLEIGQPLSRPGLHLIHGPGNDLVATTILAAAGCQLVLFTTGRGTPWGGAVPTLKLATHSDLARRKPHWIDFDAGRLLAGAARDALADELLAQVLETASGRRQTANERNACREIALFKDGPTL